jgi:4-amino-4-deoxy-L-arabinose transferase-like glycosyltransferase
MIDWVTGPETSIDVRDCQMSMRNPSKHYYWRTFERYFPVLLFVLVLFVRLGIIFALKSYTSPYHYSEHVEIADNILKGRGYSFRWYGLGPPIQGSFMPPPYVAIVLAARLLFPSAPWLAVQVFQAFLSFVSAVLVYLIGKEIFTQLTGMIASLLMAVYPPSLAYVLDIQSLVWETFWVLLIVLAYVYWARHKTWKRALFVGFVLGVLVLSRPPLILLAPLLLVLMVLSYERRAVPHFAAVCGVCILVLGPWLWRNYLVHDRFVFVSTNGAIAMFEGNNQYATGVSYRDMSDLWLQHPQLAQELAGLDDASRASRLYQESITYARAHPKETMVLALKKFVYFWWFKPRFTEGGAASGYPRYFGIFYMVAYAVLLGFAALGISTSRKQLASLYIIYGLFAIQTAISMITIAGTRYRAVLEPLLAILAACAIGWLISEIIQARGSIPPGLCWVKPFLGTRSSDKGIGDNQWN